VTRTSWATTGDVPAGPWATLSSDLRTLLGVMAAGGATLTNPAATGGPSFTAEAIGFTVTLPERGPLTVEFRRKAGEGTVETSSPMTDSLVLAAVQRAQRAWGLLVSVTSDAGTEARAIAATVTEALYGAGDRAVAGGAALDVRGKVGQAIAEVLDTVARDEQIAVDAAADAAADELFAEQGNADGVADVRINAAAAARYDLATYLGEVLVELDAHRDGVAAATALLTGTPAVP